MSTRDIKCAIRRTMLLVVSAPSCNAFEASLCGEMAALAARRDMSSASIVRVCAPFVLGAPCFHSASQRHPTLGGTRGQFSMGLGHKKRRLCLQSSGQGRCDLVCKQLDRPPDFGMWGILLSCAM